MTTKFELLVLLRKCWGADTAKGPWKEDVPSLNQCAVTALIVQDMLGGDILRAPMSDGDGHYHNRLPDGYIADLTSGQLPHIEAEVDFTATVVRTRQYVLSYPDTMRRYAILLGRLAEALEAEDEGLEECERCGAMYNKEGAGCPCVQVP